MEHLKAIILAAGEGTRMKSKKPKVLHEIMKKSMLDYVMDTAKGCGALAICVVIGHQAEAVREAAARQDVVFAVQTERKGTGHVMKLKEKQRTGAQLLIDALKEEQVEIVFGYPGGAVLPLYDCIYDSDLRHILTRHEGLYMQQKVMHV